MSAATTTTAPMTIHSWLKPRDRPPPGVARRCCCRRCCWRRSRRVVTVIFIRVYPHKLVIVTVRVRFAPSPTGSLHIGSVRTTLYNYLFAKQHKGTLILRIEDTDQDRLVEGAIDSIYDGLRWMGLDWDEGPREGGPHAPYVQSERRESYQRAARQLVEQNAAYFCFCSKERLAAVRAQQAARGEVTRYDRHCRSIDPGA